jgi:hypothetical protein
MALGPVNKAITQHRRRSFLGKIFVSILKNGPGDCQDAPEGFGCQTLPSGKSLATKGCIISLTKYSLLKLR